MATGKSVFRFMVTLRDVDPPVWRRIEVPGRYTFWELHVAIQDAMGWSDSHLHAFRVPDPDGGGVAEIGIPDEEPAEDGVVFLPGWERAIADFFRNPGDRAEYEYDFGDGWIHEVVLEAVAGEEPGARYPRCTGGGRACPPEDCGGPEGYAELLAILADRDDERHGEAMEWVGERFAPEEFDPASVRFDDPTMRWRIAFG